MGSIRLPLQSYQDGQASTSRLVNCFIQPQPEGSPFPVILKRTPGISQWGTAGTGPIEGLYTDHGLLYAVSGGGFYSITSGAVATLRGAVGSSTEIDMDSNDVAVVIVSPPDAYSYTPGSTTFAQITDSDFTSRGAGDVEFCGNFMLFREPLTGRIFGADLGSVSAFDALNFFTAEGSPDAAVGLKVDHEQVLPFGERSVELWRQAEISGFPFEKVIGGFIECGCSNGKTVAKLDNSVMFVAHDFTVRRLDGMNPVAISSHAVDAWLKTVTLASLRGYSYALRGHNFYLLTAPEGAFVYNANTQLWHELNTYQEDTWNWANPVLFAGKVLVGSTTSNVIGELDPALFTELDETLRCEWTYQPVYNEGDRAYHDELEMIMQVGVGTTSGQGSSPSIMLSLSDDGGVTWRNLPSKSLGAIGKYATRVRWVSLGSCSSPHGRVYKAAVSDPVQMKLMDTQLKVRGGRV